MKYKATITETLEKTMEIEADNVDEAQQKLKDLYYSGEIILTADDCVTELTDFTVEVL